MIEYVVLSVAAVYVMALVHRLVARAIYWRLPVRTRYRGYEHACTKSDGWCVSVKTTKHMCDHHRRRHIARRWIRYGVHHFIIAPIGRAGMLVGRSVWRGVTAPFRMLEVGTDASDR